MKRSVSPAWIIPKACLPVLLAAGTWFVLAHPAQTPKDGKNPLPNLILITIDTLRADYVSSLNSDSPVPTPTLDALAEKGTVFEQAFTTNPLTLPAHASLMTGMWPMGHGVRDFTGFRIPDGLPTLAETLAASGYETAAFISAAVLDAQTGMNHGFRVYHDQFGSFLGSDRRVAQRGGAETLELARQWLLEKERSPFFLWIHLYEPHDPYQPPEPFRSRFPHNPYAGEVAYTDFLLGEFFRFLKERGLFEPSVLSILSDHGEGLGEHGESRHGFFIYNSTMRIPWILKIPGAARAGLRVTQNVSIVDVYPTLLHALGVPRSAWPDHLQGQSRYRLAQQGGENASPELLYLESLTPRLQYGWGELRGVVFGPWKYIEAPRPELYQSRDDPEERDNLYASRSTMALQLRDQLRKLQARFEERAEAAGPAVDPDLQERLRSLGYAGLSSPFKGSPSPHLADPKDKIRIYELAQQGVEAARERQWAVALEKLSAAAREEPASPAILSSLALAFRDSGRIAESIPWFEKVLEVSPQDPYLRRELVRSLLALGRLEEAAAHLEKILQQDPRNFLALFNLGTLRAQQGRMEEAIQLFEKALQVRQDEGVLKSLALAHLYRGDLDQAETLLLQALSLRPHDRQVHLQLAEVYRRMGRPEKAAEHARLARSP